MTAQYASNRVRKLLPAYSCGKHTGTILDSRRARIVAGVQMLAAYGAHTDMVMQATASGLPMCGQARGRIGS